MPKYRKVANKQERKVANKQNHKVTKKQERKGAEMNKILTITIIALFTAGCGITDRFNEACSGDLDNLCQAFFGVEEDREPTDYETDLYYQISILEQELNNLQSSTENNAKEIELLELEIQNLEADLAEVQTSLRVTDIIDPCGDFSGKFDEVLLQLSNGAFVAYFKESGSREFLTVLTDGNYQTTDAQKCNFSIVSGNYLE